METAKSTTREDRIARLTRRIDEFEKYKQPHSGLMAELAVELATRFGLPETDVAAISEATLLHDIGLFAMSPVYHSMPLPLDMEDRIDLWRHPIIGEQQMAKNNCSRHAQLLVRWHHEWWNGTGYPDKLSFEDIPIGARILRAVELYSALSSDRPYRFAFSESEVKNQLRCSAGIECDPYVVEALLALIEDRHAAADQAEVGSHRSSQPEPIADLQPPIEPETEQLLASPFELAAESLVHSEPEQLASEAAPQEQAAHQSVAVESRSEPLDAPFDEDLTPLLRDFVEEATQQAGSWPTVSGPDAGQSERLEQTAHSATDPDAATQAPEHPRARLNEIGESDPLVESAPPDRTIQERSPGLPSEAQQEASGADSTNRPSDHFNDDTELPLFAGAELDQDSESSASPVDDSDHTSEAPSNRNSAGNEQAEPPRWNNWRGSPSKRKPLLGFEASVFSQIAFDSIAIPFCGWANLEWYLNARGVRIFSNDPRAWAAEASMAALHSDQAILPDMVDALCAVADDDDERPLTNPSLLRWFDPASARFMDALRGRIDEMESGVSKAHAIVVGLRTGDYAQSFEPATAAMKQPLPGVFRRLASRSGAGFPPEAGSKSLNLPAREFIRRVRADLLYLSIPPGQQDPRNTWREAWTVGITGTGSLHSDDLRRLQALPQSKKAYVSTLDELLKSAGQMPVWAVACQDAGLASVSEITDLIEDHRKVKVTYSKDTSEVAGGSQNYIILAENN